MYLQSSKLLTCHSTNDKTLSLYSLGCLPATLLRSHQNLYFKCLRLICKSWNLCLDVLKRLCISLVKSRIQVVSSNCFQKIEVCNKPRPKVHIHCRKMSCLNAITFKNHKHCIFTESNFSLKNNGMTLPTCVFLSNSRDGCQVQTLKSSQTESIWAILGMKRFC